MTVICPKSLVCVNRKTCMHGKEHEEETGCGAGCSQLMADGKPMLADGCVPHGALVLLYEERDYD